MSFLGEVQPKIDWHNKYVFVGSTKLPNCKLESSHAKADVIQPLVSCTNSFGSLKVPECFIDNDDPEVTPSIPRCVTAQTNILKSQKQCSNCDKRVQQIVDTCARCKNHSFANLDHVVQCGDCDNVQCENDSTENTPVIEFVELNQFTREGKRGQYESYGVITLRQPDVVQLNVADVESQVPVQQFQAVKQYCNLKAFVDAFNQAQVCGYQSIELQCNNCRKYQLSALKPQKSQNVQICQFCTKSIQTLQLPQNSVFNPIATICNKVASQKKQFADVAIQKQQLDLNFTHRTSHGAGEDSNANLGKFAQLAKQQLDILKHKYPEVFAEPKYPVNRQDCPHEFQHEIRLQDPNAQPPRKKLYPLDNIELEELKKQLQEFLETNRIVPSQSPYGAPILFAKKKGGSLRMCIDYRLLNQQTIQDSSPLPRIDELLQRLDGSTVFSKLDLRDGYHQIPMKKEDCHKTAFSCRYGTFEFLVMPFGLSTAPGTFQRMMNTVFFNLLDNGVVCYLDDLLIYTKTIQQHKLLLDKVFQLLSKNKLYLKDSKCHLFLERVNFLGHVVSSQGVAVENGKVQAVQDWPVPQSVNQVQQFLGLANYYRRFVLRFSEIAGPLTQLTRKGQPFVWEQEQQKAFDVLKQCLCTAPVLKLFDKSLSTRVVCDASNFCIGAVLEQKHPNTGKWHPVEYYSKRLSSSERNYSATDREFVAIRLALDRWRHFLIGIKFIILTDHAALTHLQTSAGVNRRNARWLDFLSQFSFEILHIKGRENVVADTLSRVPGSEFLTSFELCSNLQTLGVSHVEDMPLKACVSKNSAEIRTIKLLNGIISINEKESFRTKLIGEQHSSSNKWFQDITKQAKQGSCVYQHRNDLLCRLNKDHFCPVIPDRNSSTIQVILSDLHSSALGGHLGRRKLLAACQSRFYWQNMYQSVDKFCKECSICQQNKGSTQKPHGKLQPLENPDSPFSHISMDFIMNLPVSVRGYDAIFTIVDRFSRLVRFIPCKSDLTAQDTAQLFFEHWICRFGMPVKIISDRDPRFQSVFWQSLMQCLQCRTAMSTSYHPQTDGLTERFHRSVEQILRCYCCTEQSNWCLLLSQCEFALNSSVQDSHNLIPFQVVYGTVPQLPLDAALPIQSEYAKNLVSARSRIHTQVQQAQQAASQRMAARVDKHRRESELATGMKVWLSTANLPLKIGTRKLAEKWTGPFLITKQVTKEAWKLALPATWRIHDVFHTSQLKPVRGEPRLAPPVQLEDPSLGEEFEVSRILDKRVVRGKIQYLVRWKGYGSYDDTWEPIGNLNNAKGAISKFEKFNK